ncbi:MAG: S-layer homology domain-containing protein [Oscillospiraceae bacterium]
MKKRLLSALLALCLCVTAAGAVGNGKGFQHKHQAQQYQDVQNHWCAPYAKSCGETGLMNGVGNGFAPNGLVKNAQVAAVAARIREVLTGEAIPLPTPKQGETILWYQGYMDYLTAAGVIGLGQPQENATRGSVIAVLGQVVPPEQLTAINEITALPDTADETVLRCYNAGILTGIDAYGSFHAAGTLKRCELAAMVARITDVELRQKCVLQTETDPLVALLGFDGTTPVATVNGEKVPAFVCAYSIVAATNLVAQDMAENGLPFGWKAYTSAAQTKTANQAVAEKARDMAVQYVLVRQLAATHKVTLTAEDLTALTAQRLEMMGGGSYQDYLTGLHTMGITDREHRWILETTALSKKLAALTPAVDKKFILQAMEKAEILPLAAAQSADVQKLYEGLNPKKA